MKLPRSSGILLHPTSLPGRYGIGDLGESAYRFVEFLAESGQQWWQIMPLGPTGYGDSPYQSLSAFAGNIRILSLDWLMADGLLADGALDEVPDFPTDRIDFGQLTEWQDTLLDGVASRFAEHASEQERAALHRFAERNGYWLHDYALFAALKRREGRPWYEWPESLRLREPDAIDEARRELDGAIENEIVLQYLFDKQWDNLKRYANSKGVGIIGDVPIFVGYDSAEVWSARELFELDEQGAPRVVAGVPPDYFSRDGQRWGNPLYRWDRIAEQGFDWWVARMARLREMTDVVRLDHFRGFQAYWEIPADAPSAVDGRWVEAPGDALFAALRERLGDIPIIAENLGLVTDEVEALRRRWDFPGMRVLQFAFDLDPANPHLPHNYRVNSVVYTGTHDNDTTRGWWATLDEKTQYEVLRYLGRHHLPPARIVPQLVRQALRSVAAVAIIPMQDILNLDSQGRMNRPGDASGNWGWRFEHHQLTGHLIRWLREMTELYGRLPGTVEPTG